VAYKVYMMIDILNMI